MNRRNNEPPVSDELKGKHKDTMKGMFDQRPRDSESFYPQIIQSLDENKSKYDRELYSDWIIKVYNKCLSACLKPPLDQGKTEESDKGGENGNGKLRFIEQQCGKNCIRKFDKGYKLFGSVER